MGWSFSIFVLNRSNLVTRLAALCSNSHYRPLTKFRPKCRRTLLTRGSPRAMSHLPVPLPHRRSRLPVAQGLIEIVPKPVRSLVRSLNLSGSLSVAMVITLTKLLVVLNIQELGKFHIRSPIPIMSQSLREQYSHTLVMAYINWCSIKKVLVQQQTKSQANYTVKDLGQNVRDAYITIAMNWCEGDEIYLLGFSLGAYTVRAVASLICRYGIIKPSLRAESEYASWTR